MNKYINKLLVSVFTISLVVCSSSAMHNEKQDIGQRYLNFLGDLGLPNYQTAFSGMELLFSPNCCKTINGELRCQNIEELQAQLREARGELGEYTMGIHEENCILFPDDNTYVLQFNIENPLIDQPDLIVIAYIKFDENGLITDINEAYAKKRLEARYVKPQKRNPSKEIDSEELKRAARLYIESLQDFGKPGYQGTALENLISQHAEYSRSTNGLADRMLTGEELRKILHQEKSFLGSWTIKLDEEGVIASPLHNVCMVRYEIIPTKANPVMNIAYLIFDEHGRLKETNTVCGEKDS